jgi:BRCT domain type II-containing protein
MKELENNNESKLPVGQRDKESVILNKDAEFENREVDPGFTPVSGSDDSNSVEDELDDAARRVHDGAEQGTDRNAPGLGELDGTNPGSNHHPMDDEWI